MKTTPIILTDAQLKWLDKHFKHTKNAGITARLGISESYLHRLARKRGLVKTKQFMKKCQNHAADMAKRSHLKNGTYPPQGYIIPGSEKYRFKKGITPCERLGKKVNEQRIKNSAKSRAKTVHKEKARIAFGLPQKTKLRVIKQSRERITMRYYLKKLNYILDEENRIAYYDELTKRGKRIESKQQPWYQFRPLE